MLEALKFVKGAIAKKDFQPALTHFRIGDGQVLGYNGTLALAGPIPLEITALPKALPFVKAIERCTDETTVVHLSESGTKLGLKSGRFKAYIDCMDDVSALENIKPEGSEVSIGGNLIEALHVLEPFISNDASRPWSNGILLRGCSAFATNNIIVAEYWLGEQVPEVNLPASAVTELIRINEEPEKILIGERSMTFFFEGQRWMRTQLLSTEWPDLRPVLDAVTDMDYVAIPEDFFETVETLAPFVGEEGRLYFREGEIRTSPNEGEGASCDIEGLPAVGAFHHKQLALLEARATVIDFTKHPKPCPFQGEMLRGVILGMVDS